MKPLRRFFPRGRSRAEQLGAARPLLLAGVVLLGLLALRGWVAGDAAEGPGSGDGGAGNPGATDRDPVRAAERGPQGETIENAAASARGRFVPDEVHPSAGSSAGGPPAWNAKVLRRLDDWRARAVRASPAIRAASEVRVSVCVRDLESGVELCDLEASRPFVPASNMKLVTTAAALVLLGPDMEFETTLLAKTEPVGGRLDGDLVVRAGGDPLVRRAGHVPEAPLTALAERLVADGLRHVGGDLVLDEADFADPAPPSGWPDASQHWASYCALAGGFSVNGGVLDAFVEAGAVGSRAGVRVEPAEHGLKRRYDVDTVARGGLDIRVGATRSAVTVRGSLPRKVGDYAADFAHPDPVALFGAVLRAELERAGVRIDGEVVRQRRVPADVELARLLSPLVDVLEPINAESENGVADQVFLTLGHLLDGDGSRAGAERATRRGLERLGVDSSGFRQVDGSGLSRDNRVSARQIVSLLAAVVDRAGPTARIYRDSLAVAGQRGTLEDRMQGSAAEGRVFAKTGWISGASSLSGLIQTVEGRQLAFSILVSYPRGAGGMNRRVFKPMQDALVIAFTEEAP